MTGKKGSGSTSRGLLPVTGENLSCVHIRGRRDEMTHEIKNSVPEKIHQGGKDAGKGCARTNDTIRFKKVNLIKEAQPKEKYSKPKRAKGRSCETRECRKAIFVDLVRGQLKTQNTSKMSN